MQVEISGQTVLIDDENQHLIKNFSFNIGTGGYVVCYYSPIQNTSLHRLVLDYEGNLQIDHINGNRLDNRKCNLRICTRSQNQMNTSKRSGNHSSKYKGVSWRSWLKSWRATITYQRKNKHIGDFKNEEDAARAYDKKAKELHGEFAKLNFPE